MTYYDVIDAKILDHLKFWVKFADGVAGNVVIKATHLTGVFEPLSDPEFFNRLEIQNGFIARGENIDLAPDACMMPFNNMGNGCWLNHEPL